LREIASWMVDKVGPKHGDTPRWDAEGTKTELRGRRIVFNALAAITKALAKTLIRWPPPPLISP
jgi:hypothetical protein